MVNELRTMLHDTVRVPPADGTDVRDVLGAARGRVRRRRARAAIGAAALAVCVGATPALVGALGDLTGTTGGPAAGTPPVGPVLHIADATPAVEGRDYEVLTTLVNENLEIGNGKYFNGVTEDGRIVVQDGPHDAENRIRWGLLDPRTKKTQWLPETPDGAAHPQFLLRGTAERLVFLAEVSKPGALVVWTYDLPSKGWEQQLIDVSATGMNWENSYLAGSRIGPGDRLYFGVTIGDRLVQSRLWSVPLDGEGDPGLRAEGIVGDWDIDGDELTFTESTNKPSSIIHVRNLATGEERSFDAQSGSRCNALGLDQVDERIVLAQFCGDTPEGRDDRVQIITTDGEPVVTLQDDGLDIAGATDEFVTVRSYGEDASGVYAYDLDTGRFLRLGEGHVRYAGSHVGRDDVLTWTTPVNRGNGMKIWVARFD